MYLSVAQANEIAHASVESVADRFMIDEDAARELMERAEDVIRTWGDYKADQQS